MSPDPFRALDPIDPPDQWAAIAERAAAEPADLPVDLDQRRRPRGRALVAAAAVVVLLGGGLALATRDGDDPQGVAAGPTTEEAGRPEACPFALDSTAEVPRLEPGRLPGSPTLGATDVVGARQGHGDTGPVEVDVRAGAVDLVRTEGHAALTSTSDDGERRWVIYERPVPSPRPGCEVVVVTYEAVDERAPDERVPEVERIAAAVRLVDVAGRAQGCEVTFDDPGLPPFTPKAEGEEEPFQVLPDLTDSWLRAEVDGALVLVGVGTPEDGELQPVGTRWVSTEADFSTGAALAKVDAYIGLADDGPCVGAAVQVVFPLTDVEVQGLEVGTITQPDITDEAALASRVLDALVVDGAGTPEVGATVEGELEDGTPYAVWADAEHGLCVRLSDVALGCDDEGPVIPPDADPSTARLAVDGCCTPIWYGFLPEDGARPELQGPDGVPLDVDPGIDGDVWVLPVPAEHAQPDTLTRTDTTVAYRAADGTERPAPAR